MKQDADRDGSGSMDFQEFVEMMIKVGIEVNFDSFYIRFKKWRCFTFQEVKMFCIHLQRESEKETVQELKQAFRVFDKVSPFHISIVRLCRDFPGWQRLHHIF